MPRRRFPAPTSRARTPTDLTRAGWRIDPQHDMTARRELPGGPSRSADSSTPNRHGAATRDGAPVVTLARATSSQAEATHRVVLVRPSGRTFAARRGRGVGFAGPGHLHPDPAYRTRVSILDAITQPPASRNLSQNQIERQFTGMGLRSMLSFQLLLRAENLGALNLYARIPGAFDDYEDTGLCSPVTPRWHWSARNISRTPTGPWWSGTPSARPRHLDGSVQTRRDRCVRCWCGRRSRVTGNCPTSLAWSPHRSGPGRSALTRLVRMVHHLPVARAVRRQCAFRESSFWAGCGFDGCHVGVVMNRTSGVGGSPVSGGFGNGLVRTAQASSVQQRSPRGRRIPGGEPRGRTAQTARGPGLRTLPGQWRSFIGLGDLECGSSELDDALDSWARSG